jgi:hypothetical protein
VAPALAGALDPAVVARTAVVRFHGALRLFTRAFKDMPALEEQLLRAEALSRH